MIHRRRSFLEEQIQEIAPQWIFTLREQLADQFENPRHGDFARWQSALASLPVRTAENIRLDQDIIQIGEPEELDFSTQKQLKSALLALKPWRKGPFKVFDTHIDSEWRCDFKWQRISQSLPSLKNTKILDVGCGNGYYALRMLGAGARLVIGIDPSLLFVHQFEALSRFLPSSLPAFVLPLKLEDVPTSISAFDYVFSMGVLYHRRDPLDHLSHLHSTLAANGIVLLETLILDTSEDTELIPKDRYAAMRNVWSVPSPTRVESWLRASGFDDIQLIDKTPTHISEQRSTEWMDFHSLKNFLNPEDSSKTIEGYPAPIRATWIAKKLH